ncbi:hypothetical protein QQS21_004403 [Conoideocrella luteorostrata]|uniref:Uncharacterized protein n=1 Tax=Conoideocrella luteorostrata TaxID=1105319 RepID=A0AAJ0CTZ4_9HYPO|nr:hypothetical protein QQS21_004403 [Conoideocrella luteorostrata]
MIPAVIAALVGAALAGGKKTKLAEPTLHLSMICADKCTERFYECTSAPNANAAHCGAQYSSCLGYNPFENGAGHPTSCRIRGEQVARPTPTKTQSCARKCNANYEICRTKPHANQIMCASNYADCLGFSPFATKQGESFATPTACKPKPRGAMTTMTAEDGCGPKCLDDFLTCKANSDVNSMYCAGVMALCLGYSPFNEFGAFVPSACRKIKDRAAKASAACAEGCLNEFYTCEMNPSINESSCASHLAICVGYNPYENGFKTPTACSKKVFARAVETAAPTTDTCAKKCTDEWNECSCKLNANISGCASKFGDCLGYTPVIEPGKFTTPTACSTAPLDAMQIATRIGTSLAATAAGNS